MERPRLTLREAAAATGTSYSTLRRRRDDGAFPNATKDTSRGWLIPVEDLLAAGLRLNAPAPPDVPAETAPTIQARTEPGREQLLAELAAAKTEAATARTEARLLRELLAAKDDHVTDLRRQVLMLTSGRPEPEQAHVPGQPTGRPAEQPGQPGELPPGDPAAAQRPRWWARGSARHRKA